MAEPLEGHPRYKKLEELNEGTFGFVQLALDTKTNTQVSTMGWKCLRGSHQFFFPQVRQSVTKTATYEDVLIYDNNAIICFLDKS